MPRGDGSGPMGAGPMSGRAAGFCAGYGVAGCDNPMPGGGRGMGMRRGFGRGGGFGRGRGFGAGYGARVPMAVAPVAPMNAEAQMQALKTQADGLQQALDDIRQRMEQLQATPEND